MSFDINLAKSPHEIETTSSLTVRTGELMDCGKTFNVPIPNEEDTKKMLDDCTRQWFKGLDNNQSTAAADSWINLPHNQDTTVPAEELPDDICEGIDFGLGDDMSVMSSYYPDGSRTYTVTNVKTIEYVNTILLMMKKMMDE